MSWMNKAAIACCKLVRDRVLESERLSATAFELAPEDFKEIILWEYGARYSGKAHLPERMEGAYLRHLLRGIPPGSFLTAVLENNLSEAFGRADLESQATMFSLVSYLYNHAPIGCKGSAEAVKAWQKERQEKPIMLQHCIMDRVELERLEQIAHGLEMSEACR